MMSALGTSEAHPISRAAFRSAAAPLEKELAEKTADTFRKVTPVLLLFPSKADLQQQVLGNAEGAPPEEIRTMLIGMDGEPFEERHVERCQRKALVLNFCTPFLEVYPKKEEHCALHYDTASLEVVPETALASNAALFEFLDPFVSRAEARPIVPYSDKMDIQRIRLTMEYYRRALQRGDWRLAFNRTDMALVAHKMTTPELGELLKALGRTAPYLGERIYRQDTAAGRLFAFSPGDYVVVDIEPNTGRPKADDEGLPLVRTINETAFESTYNRASIGESGPSAAVGGARTSSIFYNALPAAPGERWLKRARPDSAVVAEGGAMPDPLWCAPMLLDDDAQAQLTRLFDLLDTNGDGRIGMVDLPSHWAEVSRALQPASSDASSGDAALDFGAFVARMKALALSRPHEVDLFQRKRGEQLVSNGDCLRRLGEGLNRSIEGLCREVYAVVSHAAALRLYDLGDVLGEGGFGSVRLITARQSKRTYALKLIPKVSSRASEACEELRIMQAVSPHPHIISLVDAFEQLDAYCLVLELAEGGPLFERLAKSGAYAERDASGVLRQVASALAHLHRLDITHRDLKPENLLLRSASGEPSIALCDFGLSGSGELRGICGTLPYMAPEILKGVVYSYEVDIWALGVVLYNVLSGHQPFDPAGTADSVTYEKRIASCSWSFDSDPGWGGVSAPAKALLSGLLQLDPARRLTAQQILEVPWVRGEASATPLPAVARQLSRLTEDRLVWHAAMRALVLIVNAPSAAVVGGSAAPPPSSTAATAELRAAFDLMDRNRDGHIDGAELRQLLRSLGAQEHEIEQVVARTLSAIDVDGDARISFEEYCVGVAPLFTASTEALRTAFRLFDTDGSGRIDRSEFAQMLCKLGLPVGSKPEDMERIFASADADGDGEISFAEFYALACSGAVEHDGDQRMGGLLSAVSSSL